MSSSGPAFRIITCAYNAGDWIERCVQSIRAQTDADWRCIVIDDGSPDDTYERAKQAIGSDDRFVLHQADGVGSALANRAYGIAQIATDPDDVVVVVDGDDWLAHPGVLARLAEVYADPDVWLTYGSHIRWRGMWRDRFGRKKRGEAREYPRSIADRRWFRYHRFRASHLRTFRSFLWNAIRTEDLKDEQGEWIGPAGDVADMVPMLEMAGGDRIRYLSEVLYIYNDATPLSDRKVKRDEQVLNDALITSRPIYPLLERPTGDDG